MRVGLRWFSVVALAISAGALLVWAPPGKAVNGCSVPVVGDVYQVSTAAHVQALHTCSLDGDFVQTADIVMPAPTTSSGVTSNFVPFGALADPFTGTYDGRGHSISGLRFDAPDLPLVGLFGFTQDASVANLRLEDVAFVGSSIVGGLAGAIGNSDIRNIRVSGHVEGHDYLGGIAGYALADRTLALDDVHFVGEVQGTGDVAGGVLGGIEVEQPSPAVTFVGELTRISARGEVRSGRGVGGLVGGVGLGPLSDQSRLRIAQAVVFNDVYGGDSVGGGIGILSLTRSDGRIVVSDLYAMGAVNGGSNVGGVLGGTAMVGPSGGSIDLERVYARGAVRATGSDFGGLVGIRLANSPEYASVTASFWNPTSAGVAVSDGGTESTVAAMRTLGLYRDAGWAIVDEWAAPAADRVWGICASVNDGYPYLLWEYAEDPCERPAAPTNVMAQPSDRSALVTFTEPAAGDAPITGYEYSVDDGASWSAFAAARSTGPLRITGLRNGTEYQVRVRARNAYGGGPASAAVRVVPRTNQVTLSKPRRSSPYSVVVRMRVQGPGVASIVGTRPVGDRRRARVRVCRSVLRPRKPGIVVLRCRVNAATRAALRDGAVSVRLRIAYRPVGGSARAVTRSIRLPAYTPTPRPVTG